MQAIITHLNLPDGRIKCVACKEKVDRAAWPAHAMTHGIYPREPAPTGECVHRGAEIRREQCGTCPNGVKLKVFSCALPQYGECCIDKTVAGVHSCNGCRGNPANASRLPTVATPFTPQKLAVVTSHFNPHGYKKNRAHYDRFAAGMRDAGASLFTVEAAFDSDPFTIGGDFGEKVIQVRGTRKLNTMWQKERLLNVAIANVPEEFDAIAWIDADVVFPVTTWPAQAIAKLRNHEVVQLFSRAYNLRDNGAHESLGESLGSMWASGRLTAQSRMDGWPGLAWAARARATDWIRTHGIFDSVISSCADTFLACGFTGQNTWARGAQGSLRSRLDMHARKLHSIVRGSIGCLPLSLAHLYHGSFAQRNHAGNFSKLTQGGFDPETDIRIDDAGLWAWTDSAIAGKPGLVKAVSDMFAARREDE